MAVKTPRRDGAGVATIAEAGPVKSLRISIGNDPPPRIEGVSWSSLDFSGGMLAELLFFGGEITDCVFDKCNCENIGFWSVHVSDCSFTRADLKGASIGALGDDTPKPNVFEDTVFDGADLRGSIHYGEHYYSCSFRNCRINGLSFDGSVFENCVFEGAIRDVSFFKRPHRFPAAKENRLLNCDFSRCTLEFVDFRNIDLSDVKLPDDEVHIILKNGGDTLRNWRDEVSPSHPLPHIEYVTILADRAGTPSMINAHDLEGLFTKAEIDRLRVLAGQ